MHVVGRWGHLEATYPGPDVFGAGKSAGIGPFSMRGLPREELQASQHALPLCSTCFGELVLSRPILSGPATSTIPLTGSASAASLTARATSSDAMGWRRAVESRIVCPAVLACTMPPTNSASVRYFGKQTVGPFLAR